MSAGGQTSSSQSASNSFSDSLSEYFSNAFSSNSSSSQNSSQSGTSESELSKEQLQILQNREQQYNQYFFPEIKNAIEENSAGSSAFNATLSSQANNINSSYDAAQKATEQTLAQQGIDGEKNGVNAALKAANNRARSSSLAQAYYNTLSSANSNKNTLLGTLGSLMTTPTNSAEYYSSSTSQGTSQSQGSSTSESGGKSESHSESWSSSSGHGSGWNAGLK